MRALTLTAEVRPDHTLTIQVPPDIPPGVQTIVIVLADTKEASPPPAPLTFHPHRVGPTDPNLTFRREDIYGDDGR